MPLISFSQRSTWTRRQAISFLMQQAVENRHVLSLAAGLVDESTLPATECQAALQELLSDPSRARSALQYGTTQGADVLREQLVEHVARLEGVSRSELGVGPDQFMATTGSQQFLSLAAETLLDPGDICLVAAPTYFVFLGVLNGVGARAIPVTSDADGMRMDALEARLQELERAGELRRVKVIYLVSDFENPSGVCLSASRRREVVEIARRWSRQHRILILEDAAYRELRYDGEPLPSVWSCDPSHEHVVYTQTFSKSFAPGIRVGFGIATRELVGPLCDRKGNEDFGSANLNQHLLATILASGQYASHLRQVLAGYRAKRDAMLAACEEFFADLPGVSWVHPAGGLYVWMSLPASTPTGFDSPLFSLASKRHEVMYVPGELCYPSDRLDWTAPHHQMRLSFGVLNPERIHEAVRRLARAVRDVISSPAAAGG